MNKLIEALERTKKKEYKLLAKRMKKNLVVNDPEEARLIRRKCMVILVDELDKYENDDLINQLLVYVGREIKNDEKANQK